jgi:hypothetical protein
VPNSDKGKTTVSLPQDVELPPICVLCGEPTEVFKEHRLKPRVGPNIVVTLPLCTKCGLARGMRHMFYVHLALLVLATILLLCLGSELVDSSVIFGGLIAFLILYLIGSTMLEQFQDSLPLPFDWVEFDLETMTTTLAGVSVEFAEAVQDH